MESVAKFRRGDEGVIGVGWENTQPLAGVSASVKDAFGEGLPPKVVYVCPGLELISLNYS